MFYQGNTLKKRKSYFRLGFACVAIVLLVVVIEAWGHDTPKIRDGSQTHTLSKVWSDGEGHWHEDADGRGAGNWDDCVADAYDPDTNSYNLPGGRCADELPSTPEPPLPEPELITLPPDPTPITPQPESPTPDPPPPLPPPPPPPPAADDEPKSDPPEQSPDVKDPVDPPVEPKDPETITEMLDDVAEQEPIIPDPIKEVVEEMPEPEVEDTRETETYEFDEGWNLVMFSLLPEGVTTLATLYPHLLRETVLVVNIDGCWLMYQGEGETGEVKLHPNMGVALYAPTAFNLTLTGNRIKLVTSFAIHAGLNLIGFSQPPPELTKPSTLFSDTGICAVIRMIDGEFYLIGRAGDRGDTDLMPNEAFMTISVADYELEWQTPAAPQTQQRGTLAISWGAIKRQ